MSHCHFKGPKNGICKAQSAIRSDKKLSKLAERGLLELEDTIPWSKQDSCAQQAVSVGGTGKVANHEDVPRNHTSTADEQYPESKKQTMVLLKELECNDDPAEAQNFEANSFWHNMSKWWSRDHSFESVSYFLNYTGQIQVRRDFSRIVVEQIIYLWLFKFPAKLKTTKLYTYLVKGLIFN